MNSRRVLLLLLPFMAVACAPPVPTALGTLERDRITLPAPVSERIAEIRVREGEAVGAGTVLLVLEDERTRARLDVARAEVTRLQSALGEARAGPRVELIDAARARLKRSESVALNARRERERTEAVVARGLLPVAERDRAAANAATAAADVEAARAALAELQHGTRSEQLAQAEAALAAAQANVAALQVDLARTEITAPRDGVIDSLPFEIGDQVPVGTALAILLVGEAPHARVYVPQSLRASVRIGDTARVHLHGSEVVYAGTLRHVRSEPSFTPYFALGGDDASRLVYLAEIELVDAARELPAGLPLRAEFDTTVSP